MIVLPAAARAALLAHCEAERPREACGLLLGRREAGRLVIVELGAARNAEPERPETRFELHPADLVAGEARARAQGLELLGAWHSHPRGEALPSETDRRAGAAGWLQLIVGLGGEAPVLRAWRPEGGRLVEEAISELEE